MIRAYAQMLPELQAQQQLAAIEAAAFSKMNKQSQTDTIARYTRAIGAGARPRPATAADLQQLGITVEEVSTNDG